MKYRRNRFYGYTLLEMIMVMAIIAILLSMMFPVFANAFKKARSLGDENPNDPDGPRISPSSVSILPLGMFRDHSLIDRAIF